MEDNDNPDDAPGGGGGVESFFRFCYSTPTTHSALEEAAAADRRGSPLRDFCCATDGPGQPLQLRCESSTKRETTFATPRYTVGFRGTREGYGRSTWEAEHGIPKV